MTGTHHRLKRTDFADWPSYYRAYQYHLATDYYIPLLRKWGCDPAGSRILDVGCGDGGFTAALAERAKQCTGVEMQAFPWQEQEKLRFLVQDVTAPGAVQTIGGSFDLIVLRDVIEHIRLDQKQVFLQALRRFGHTRTRMLVTFPPYYSPFGLHQQTHFKSWLRRLPWLGAAPDSLVRWLAGHGGESQEAIERVVEVRNCRMTIAGFHRLIETCGYSLTHSLHFTIRPSHQIRYGWPTLESPLGSVPLLREFLVMGTVFLLSFAET